MPLPLPRGGTWRCQEECASPLPLFVSSTSLPAPRILVLLDTSPPPTLPSSAPPSSRVPHSLTLLQLTQGQRWEQDLKTHTHTHTATATATASGPPGEEKEFPTVGLGCRLFGGFHPQGCLPHGHVSPGGTPGLGGLHSGHMDRLPTPGTHRPPPPPCRCHSHGHTPPQTHSHSPETCGPNTAVPTPTCACYVV